LTNSSEVSF